MATLREQMEISADFDPMSLDITYIQDISNQIPEDGIIPPELAERLTIQFARGSEVCGENIAKLMYYVGRCIAAKERELGLAMADSERSGDQAITKEKKAKSDNRYVAKADRHAVAEGCLEWWRSKQRAFDKYHYIAKSIISQNPLNTNMSPTDDAFGKIPKSRKYGD